MKKILIVSVLLFFSLGLIACQRQSSQSGDNFCGQCGTQLTTFFSAQLHLTQSAAQAQPDTECCGDCDCNCEPQNVDSCCNCAFQLLKCLG